MANFPNQNISELKKDKDWCRLHFDYAESLLKNSNHRIARFERLYNVYNGKGVPNSVKYLTKQYGKASKTKFISYRVGKPKIDLLTNEFLQRPLESTVYTINESAKTAKLDNWEMLLGAAHSKEAIKKLNENGVDPMEGMDIPDASKLSEFSMLSTKDKYEVVMQTILDEQIPALDMTLKFSKNFQDLLITSMCYGRLKVDYKGNEDYQFIPGKRAIFEEIEDDTFLEKTPLMGHLEIMPIHDILMTFDLKPDQIEELEAIRTGGNDSSYGTNYNMTDGQMTANVIYLEWKSVEPEYYKVSPKSKSQLEFDDRVKDHTIELNTEKYLLNQEKHDKEVKRGRYKIKTKYKEVLWEGVRIGDNILAYCRKKPFTMRSVDNPADVLNFSYVGALFNTVNGERVSMMQVIENFSNMFDVTMYQILKDINRAKGKIIGFDRGVLPKGKKIVDVIYNAAQDQFLDYDSSGQTNMSGRDMDITSMFKVIDLGLSDSFPSLIAFKQEIMATLDRLTGVNENREGNIAASSTATNAQSSINASRTITEGFNYTMSLFQERVLLRLVETTKLTWGLGKKDKGRIILGDEKFKFMEVTKNIAHQDYGIHLTNGGEQVALKDMFDRHAEASLNAKDIRYKDFVKFKLAPSLKEGVKVLERAQEEMEKIRQQENLQAGEQQGKQQQAAQAAAVELAREDREDKQSHDMDQIEAQANADIRVNQNKSTDDAQNKVIVDQAKSEQDSINNDQSQEGLA